VLAVLSFGQDGHGVGATVAYRAEPAAEDVGLDQIHRDDLLRFHSHRSFNGRVPPRAVAGVAVPQPAGARRQPANQYRVRSFLCSPLLLYLEIPAWSPVPGLFCSALSIARRLTRNRASPNRRVHNRIAAGLAATVKLALCGFCTTDTNNILAENRWSLANRVRLHESVSSENSR
jgi:hypothetical protein